MTNDSNDILLLLLLVIVWALASQYLGQWITENLYVIETVSLLLIFGLIYEIWTAMEEERMAEAVAEAGDSIGRTTAQAGLIVVVTSLVVSSLFLRRWVESTFGPLAAVQLLAIIGILSRAFVNVRSGDDVLEILDENRSTRIVYATGVLALMLSQYLKGTYPAHAVEHNASVVFLSTIVPALYYYFVAEDSEFKSLRQRLD